VVEAGGEFLEAIQAPLVLWVGGGSRRAGVPSLDGPRAEQPAGGRAELVPKAMVVEKSGGRNGGTAGHRQVEGAGGAINPVAGAVLVCYQPLRPHSREAIMHVQLPRLETDRLLLRPFTRQDEAIHRLIYADPVVARRFCGLSAEEVAQRMDEAYATRLLDALQPGPPAVRAHDGLVLFPT
jgi:hypothetical protein